MKIARSIGLGVVLCLAQAAQAAPLNAVYSQWMQLRDPEAGVGIRFEEGRQFLADHPGWPEEKIIRLRTEAAALHERPAKAVMAKFCADNPPISGRGMFACAQAEAGNAAQITTWVTQGWVQGDFNESEEERIVKSYAKLLSAADFNDRMERLLYEGKSAGAKRMLPYMAAGKQAIYQVRLAFIANDKKTHKMLAALSGEQKRSTGILFERLRWEMKRGGEASEITAMLLSAPKEVPFPDLWWPMRALAARDALNKGNYPLAAKLLAAHGEIKGEALADALWLKGWIALRHQKDAGSAYKHFFTLYNAVYTPVSKARAAYWAGRAADKNGNHEIAVEWMQKAARHRTVFYGQLAWAWLKPGKPLALQSMPKVSDAEKKQFAHNELALIARAQANEGDAKMRDKFLTALATQANNEAQFALAAQLANEIGGTTPGLEVAKLALRNGVVLLEFGWPKIPVPAGLPIEPALTLAITRQESEFNPVVRSAADARGLMQLLPSTAKHIARKIEMDYTDALLDNPEANLRLGSSYLGQVIDGFDGSYILGIASYNAGPGNARRWIAERGMPPKNLDGAIDWVESIPFGETRNYVMRVLENVSVYRAIANPDAPLKLADDLKRGR